MEEALQCFYLLKQTGVFQRIDSDDDLRNTAIAFFKTTSLDQIRAGIEWHALIESFDKELLSRDIEFTIRETEHHIIEFYKLTDRILGFYTTTGFWFKPVDEPYMIIDLDHDGFTKDNVRVLHLRYKRSVLGECGPISVSTHHLCEAIGPLYDFLKPKIHVH